jgi:prevent-host-death family protein
MSLVPVRDLRNHTAAVIERARNGEEVIITVNGVPAASLVPVREPKKLFLTTGELLALIPGKPVTETHPHSMWDDTTDDLGPIQ